MKIESRRVNQFTEVIFIDGTTTMNLGLLDDTERDHLAQEMLYAVYGLGPSGSTVDKWFGDMLERCGIELSGELGEME